MSAYSEASKAVFAVFEDMSPLVEALSIDEAFLDVRGLEHIFGTPREIASQLRRRVREEVGLAITVGLARTKFLAKVASGVAKPDGLLVIPAGQRAGLPASAAGRAAVGRRPGHLGQAARARLTTVGQVASWARRAHGRCSDGRPAASCTRCRTTATPARCARGGDAARSAPSARWAGGARAPGEIEAALMTLVDRVSRRLRGGRPRLPHGGAAPALRRLLAGDALAHDRRGHAAHVDVAEDRPRPAGTRRTR